MDVAAALSTLGAAALELRVRDEDGGEQPFTPALAGALVGDALATLAAASGESRSPTRPPRVRSCAPPRRPRSRGWARSRPP